MRTYAAALWRHWRFFVTSGTVAAVAAFGTNAIPGWRLPWYVYVLAFLWGGGLVAGFRAWDEERAKSQRLEDSAAKRVPAGARLRLAFDPKDPLCSSFDSGDETFRVQVWNDGDRRAENVRVVLQEIEPPAPKLLLQPFPDLKTGQDTFSVPPSEGRPPVYVNVLMQRLHNAYGHTQVLRLKNASWLTPATKHLRVVLRLEADQKADPFELSFSADERNKMTPA